MSKPLGSAPVFESRGSGTADKDNWAAELHRWSAAQGLLDRLSGDSLEDNRGPGPSLHLAVFVEPFLTKLLCGEKTVETRFSLNRIPPFEAAKKGDVVLVKQCSGPIVGWFRVADAKFVCLGEGDLPRLAAEYGSSACADPDFFDAKKGARFLSLLTIGEFVRTRIHVRKRDRRGWIVIPPPTNTREP